MKTLARRETDFLQQERTFGRRKMRYIESLRDGDSIVGIYLCKLRRSAVTKNGKAYENVVLQDRTGTVDAKIWDPNSAGIGEFDAMDYVEIRGDVTVFNGALQINIKRAAKAFEGEYDPADYVPVSSRDINEMYSELLAYIAKVENPYLKQLLNDIFISDKDFAEKFKKHSAAKSVHHGFVGGLLEHTLSVTKLCDFYTQNYSILNHDLLITAALCHDIGKVYELSEFPINDYTDEGQLLGHIVMGSEMVSEKIRGIDGFPVKLGNELRHCILAHHGELEYGSPKRPALAEAMALNFADNTDAKLESVKEVLAAQTAAEKGGWLGYNKLFESNIRETSK